MIIHSILSKTKNKILPTSLQGNYGNSLGEFSNTSYGVFGAERVKGLRPNPIGPGGGAESARADFNL